MGAIFRSWWQQIKQHRAYIEVAGIIFVVVIALIIIGYWFDWTGFNGYNKVTTTHIISGTNAGTVTRTEEYQPGKGLWDWLQLLGVLAIPVVVGFGAVWFTTRQGKVADAENKDNQRENALQEYIREMSELLLHEKLRESQPGDEVRIIARVRTSTILRRLDTKRKGILLMFLNESNLIRKNIKGSSVLTMKDADLGGIDLSNAYLVLADLGSANLSGANLSGAKLNGATLSNTNLSNTDLSETYMGVVSTLGEDDTAEIFKVDLTKAKLNGANLSNADMSSVILNGADLSRANLKDATGITIEKLEKQAKSLKGAIMPNGSIHP